ncbi:MAG: PIN domain-containing protein [Chloroflexi bacterium]|nr:PIN domain-containing protein [Chloroflexota bacterium]
MRFWDSSALAALVLDEEHTAIVQPLRDGDPDVYVWWAARVECVSASVRAGREGRLTAAAERLARDTLHDLFEAVLEVAPADDVRLRAERLLGVHPLRAADALQLAAALMWARERPMGLDFVCLDRRLSGAARREGFEVLP